MVPVQVHSYKNGAVADNSQQNNYHTSAIYRRLEIAKQVRGHDNDTSESDGKTENRVGDIKHRTFFS